MVLYLSPDNKEDCPNLATRVRLRPITDQERVELIEISGSRTLGASVVAHAKQVLAVADGDKFTQAAAKSGYKAGDLVSRVVRCFNALGIDGLFPRHAGGRRKVYGPEDVEKIVELARSTPDRERDGTCVWSLSTLRLALMRRGYPHISGSKIWLILREANFTWQKTSTWCDTGTAQRKRKSGVVKVSDPDAAVKKTH